MKLLRKISSLVVVIVMSIVVACENDKIIYEGPYFVRFTDVSLTEKESHIPVLKVEVHYSNPVRSNGDVNISYVVGGSAREGVDYVINGTRGKVKIKSGDYFGYIEIQLLNNSNNIIRSQDVTLELVNAELDKPIRVGQDASQIGKIFTLTIQDDCILGGDYYSLGEGEVNAIENIKITSLDCVEYNLSNWETNPFSVTVRDLTFIDNGDNTLTIPPQQESTFDPDFATIDGFGTVNPITRVITFTVNYFDQFTDEHAPTSVTFTLTPN